MKSIALVLLGGFLFWSAQQYGPHVSEMVLFNLGYIHPGGMVVNATEDKATTPSYGPAIDQ